MKLARLALLVLACALPAMGQAEDSFAARSAAIAAAADSHVVQPIPFVHRISTEPAQPTDQSPTWLILEGTFPYPCGVIFDDRVVNSNLVTLAMRPVDVCPAVVGWRIPFNLGVLPAGPHRVEIRLRVFGADSTAAGDSTVYNGAYAFFVAPGPPPPPPGVGLPYVEQIRIDPGGVRRTGPICPSDSIRVTFLGSFPSDCYKLKRIDLIPSDIASFEPPLVRLVVANWEPCVGAPCPQVLTPWSKAVVLPPLPIRSYQLSVELLEGECSDETPPDSIPMVRVPFAVLDCTQSQCLLGSFVRSNDAERCDASVAPDRPATLTYAIQTPVALAGLEGSFDVHPPGLKIRRIEPIGPAAGMNLTWAENSRGGANFVLFAPRGAPIPPTIDTAVPVLRVTVARVAGVPTPPITQIVANAFGADGEGNAVPHCPTFAPVSASICVVAECDHNGDGHLDVRDLVLMVRCLNGVGQCPGIATLDCTHDGTFTLDDVICCARHILRRNDCPDCPRDTTGVRHEPRVRYAIGEPLRVPAGADLPITIDGADRLGGVRLALGFPSDRYDASIEVKGERPQWLDLYEERAGEVVIGLIRLGPEISRDDRLELTLALRLKPGQQPGGEVATLESEFSGIDGTPLEIEIAQAIQPLARPLVLGLSPNRPEPFDGETQFTVSVSEPSDVRVAIYDVGGRLVRMLHSGPMGAGTHEMRWDGTRGDGVAMRRGVYFYRAVAGDQTISRKMVLIGVK